MQISVYHVNYQLTGVEVLCSISAVYQPVVWQNHFCCKAPYTFIVSAILQSGELIVYYLISG